MSPFLADIDASVGNFTQTYESVERIGDEFSINVTAVLAGLENVNTTYVQCGAIYDFDIPHQTSLTLALAYISPVLAVTAALLSNPNRPPPLNLPPPPPWLSP